MKIILFALGVWLAAALAQTLSTPIATSPISFSFGMIGLAGGQTVRLNAVNIVRTPPPILIAQVPCKVELDLFDADGGVIKQSVIDNLGYGKSVFAEASLSDAGSRIPVTGVVKVGSTQSFFCSIMPTLEVYDTASGRTQAILGSAATAPSTIQPLAGRAGQ